jgi:hypothetical protein
MKHALLIAALLPLLPWPASAETAIPDDGTRTLCERDGGGTAKPGCTSNEMLFRMELERKWATIPEEFRSACVAEQAKDFAVYYSKLAVCIATKYKARS